VVVIEEDPAGVVVDEESFVGEHGERFRLFFDDGVEDGRAVDALGMEMGF
jgi:hypothetical protein